MPSGESSSLVPQEEGTGLPSTTDGPTIYGGRTSSNACVSFNHESLYSPSIPIEEGTGSNQSAVVGSMVGLLLLLMAIVGVVLLLIM